MAEADSKNVEESTTEMSVPASSSVTEDGERAVYSAALMNVLTPLVQELDQRVKDTSQSQTMLRQQMDVLSNDLRSLADTYQSPYDLEPYMRNMNDSRKRIAVVASILHNAQDRLLKLQRNIAKETQKRKAQLDAATDS